MECARTGNVDTYTRYRMVAVAALHHARERAGIETAALVLILSAFWGYVFYVVLGTIV
jgi:hypothetical protein